MLRIIAPHNLIRKVLYRLYYRSKVDYGKSQSSEILSARISLLADNGLWEVSMWGKNLTNSDHQVRSIRDFFGTVLAGYAKPRTYGVETTLYF
jgi:iron complex outermembrane receptor protein